MDIYDRMNLHFTSPELDTLRARVEEAEKGTPGEIVVFVAPRSGSYEAALWRGGAVGLLLSIALWFVLALSWRGWGMTWLWSPIFAVGLSGLGSITGAVLAHRSARFLRVLAGKKLLAHQVHHRAQQTFLEQGVAETAARTGILLFVSLLERRIEIVADKGINAIVPVDQWQEIVDLIRRGLADGEIVRGLSDGIAACGEVLRRSGISGSESDLNELSDDIRFEAD